jgi:uncharacterized membrane protein (DUF2068 family)
VNRPRLFRLAAFCDATIALLVGVLSGAELYIIRTGQFRNSNWVEPNAWATTQEWGLLFALLCMGSGYGLWKATNWARWLELLLTLPKLYCEYFELWILKMSSSFVSLLIILLIFVSLASTLFLWVPMRSVGSNPGTRSG